MGDCRVHPRPAAQPACDCQRCARGAPAGPRSAGRRTRCCRATRAGEPVAVEMTYAPPAADIDSQRSRALIAGLVGLAVCAIGFFVDRDHFFRSWLIAVLMFLGIALGSLALMMVQHLSGGAWGVFRRIFEASSRTLPLLAVLFIPVLIGGTTSLYPWSHEDHVQADEVLRHRA